MSEPQASHNKFSTGLLCFDCDHAHFLLNNNNKLFNFYFYIMGLTVNIVWTCKGTLEFGEILDI